MSSSFNNTAPRLRLEFLDGLRGLAALYVVLFHATWQFPQYVLGLAPLARLGLSLTQYGHYAVDVFIVLSGYCLMLPVARSQDGLLRGGAREYIRRRAMRILPTYYAALVLSILIPPSPMLLSSALHLLQHRPLVDMAASAGWNAAWAQQVGRHLLMIQNWPPQMSTLNPPMWSVALEWQIYFLLPLLLLPLWRRFGIAACVLGACALSVLPHFLLPPTVNLDWTCRWMLGLFAMGMGGAAVTARLASRSAAPGLSRIRWGTVSGLLAAVFAVVCVLRPRWVAGSGHVGQDMALWISDFWVGAATVAVILHCARAVYAPPDGARRSPLLRLLEARWAVGVGTFSYSLYLMHAPIIIVTRGIVAVNLHCVGARAVGLETAASVTLSLLAAYALFLTVERRFLPGHPRTERQTVAATVREPAI